jgi:hypothetical protein
MYIIGPLTKDYYYNDFSKKLLQDLSKKIGIPGATLVKDIEAW